MSAASGKASTFTFNKLWVAGNLTISGNVQLNTTGLYVGGTLTINGSSAHAGGDTDCLGPLYVAGTVIWEGASNSTVPLNVTTATTWGGTPGPMFAKILCVDGNSASGDNTAYDSTNKPGPTNVDARRRLDRRRPGHRRHRRQLLGALHGNGLDCLLHRAGHH